MARHLKQTTKGEVNQNFFSGHPIKFLTQGGFELAGRSKGRITVFHRGGGVGFRHRLVDFFHNFTNVPSKIRRFEYDPGRSALIALVCYQNGLVSYRLALKGMEVGDFFFNSVGQSFYKQPGTGLPIRYVSPGTRVSQVSLYAKAHSKLGRSAGTSIQVLKHLVNNYTLIQLPSKEQRLISSFCHCVIGAVGNSNHKYIIYGKAGVSRRLGQRPIVRGLAMNPIDHPHGGGDTKGRQPCSPWGQLAKGFRTVKNRSKFIFKPRFKNKDLIF